MPRTEESQVEANSAFAISELESESSEVYAPVEEVENEACNSQENEENQDSENVETCGKDGNLLTMLEDYVNFKDLSKLGRLERLRLAKDELGKLQQVRSKACSLLEEAALLKSIDHEVKDEYGRIIQQPDTIEGNYNAKVAIRSCDFNAFSKYFRAPGLRLTDRRQLESAYRSYFEDSLGENAWDQMESSGLFRMKPNLLSSVTAAPVATKQSKLKKPIRNVLPQCLPHLMNGEEFGLRLARLAEWPGLMRERLLERYEECFKATLKEDDIDDYKKFLLTGSNDFLSIIFHLYPAWVDEDQNRTRFVGHGHGNEIDQKLFNALDTVQQLCAFTVKQLKRQLRIEKHLYKVAMQDASQSLLAEKRKTLKDAWNGNVLNYGGLGFVPHLDSTFSNLFYKLHLADACVRHLRRIELIENAIENRKKLSKRTRIPLDECESDSLSDEESVKEETLLQSARLDSVQAQLDQVWHKLELGEQQRQIMAAKYGQQLVDESVTNDKTRQALKLWLHAAEVIDEREKLLLQFKRFESLASDPSRLTGNSVTRLREAKIRGDYMHVSF
ncbi:Coiled-coil domain-containing protein 87 [Cichlidogyrus casuarinus]|uniref:Coiled-coil domain-containing protein 87 n=1 Tax=Cichlidogyrus casuarinus TaxID=1844966 RepID=A0ABD2Q966_9PLAT